MSYTYDFETRSEVDIKKAGSYEYACHPSTDVICVSMQYKDDEPILWHPGFEDQTPLVALSKVARELPPQHIIEAPLPTDFIAAVEAGEVEIEAHNAFFERCIHYWVMVKKYGWPAIDPSMWRCSAAKAASFALPRPLQDACLALGLKEQKDMEGHRLMLKLCKPRKPLKREREMIAEASGVPLPEVPSTQTVIQLKRLGFKVPDCVFEWNQKREDLLRVFKYCKQDTRSERDLSNQLRPIVGTELEVWQMDQEMNWRGIKCDRAMATSAVRLAAESRNQAGVELNLLTNGEVQKTTDRAGFIRWLNARGVATTSTAAPMILDILESWEIDEESREALEIWKRSNKTSVKKYDAMIARMNIDDDRIRDLLMYWGASTGRWSGRGIQVQNFPRGYKGHEIEEVCKDIKGFDFDTLSLLYSEEKILEVLANALRGALMAGPGKDLIAADFSAIEARGTFWLAGEKHSLEAFRAYDRGEGADIYCVQASKIYGIPIEDVCMDKHRPNGKIAVLGCGYQMGWRKLISYAAQMNVIIDEETAQRIVSGYREDHHLTVKMWYGLQNAAIEAIRRRGRGRAIVWGHTKWKVNGRFLHCRLPNGRLISYFDPEVNMTEIVINRDEPNEYRKTVPQISFMGMDTYTHQWTRCTTYGGKLTENVIQALCRDLMAEAMLRLRGTVYNPLMTVHDEIVAEVEKGLGSLEEFIQIMSIVPKWAPGFPIASDGWRGQRFRK